MAQLRKIGVRLTAEGVSQYKEDLRTAGREARLMSQETRLAMAELGTGASSTERFTTTLKGLGNEYTVQENRVKMLTNSQKGFQTSLNMVGREIKTTSSQLKDSQRETNRLENNYRKMGEALGWNATETKKAKAEWEASKNETKELANSLNALEKEQNQYSKELEKMPGKINSAKIEMAELSNEMERVRKEYIKSGGALSGFADGIGKVSGNIRKFSDGLVNVGDTMTKSVTVPIVAGVAATVKAASDWESAFAGVVKTNDDVVDANGNVIFSLDQLESELRSLSKELPATHTEIAAVGEAAGQLGIQTDNVTSFTKTMIDMGESTNLAAQTAAESLARFANITGMSQKDFDRLGSSIVDLGNNFATTEADIVAMAMRLAGAGSQVGMSEADIMGLSAALSSVGIEAEMGGSAISKVMVNMAVAAETGLDKVTELERATGMTSRELELMSSNASKDFKALADSLGLTSQEVNKIIKAGKNLDNFAKIAGMTATEFKRAFEEDAVGALGAFIEGLGTAEKHGESAIQLLDEMGISEVRLRDALLRAGNASELFADSIKMSNDAWEENSALSEEAEVRYETLESQLGMLRNEVVDVAIDLGGPFVKALREGIEVSKPMLESARDLAQAFTELDDDTQKTIVTWLGIAAAAGPVLSVLGRIGKATATVGDGTEWLVRKIGGLQASASQAKKPLDDASDSISTIGTAAQTAGGVKGVSGFSAALGTALPWIAGLTLALGAGYGAWKLWGEGAWESSQRTKRWGTDIGEEADEALNTFQDLSEEANLATSSMALNVEENAGKATRAYTNMAEDISTSIDENISESQSTLAGFSDEMVAIVGESYQEYIAEQEVLKSEVDRIQNEINNVYQNAVQQNRDLTEEEMGIIEGYHQRLGELRTETLEMSAGEQRKVMAIMADELKEFSESQLKDRERFLHDEQSVVKESYDEQRQSLDEMLSSGEIRYQDYKEAIVQLNKEQQQAMLESAVELVKVWEEQGRSSQWIRERIAAMGLTYEEVSQKIKENGRAVEDATGIMAKELDNMSESTREANNAWNAMILDPVTGEVRTNLVETLQEVAKTDEGWEELDFVLKNANLDTNAKQVLFDALASNKEWWEMEFPIKEADLKTNSGGIAKQFLTAFGQWEGLDFSIQNAIIESNSMEQIKQILIDKGIWDRLDPREWDLLFGTNAPETKSKVEAIHSEWNGQKYEPKRLNATTNAREVADTAQRAINGVKGKTVVLRTRYETTGEAPRGIGPYATRATGDPYFQGGNVWLGDGGRREPYLTPSGHFGVSNNDWQLHNLEKGTRIWPSTQAFKTESRYSDKLKQFLQYIPKFAKGGTIENPYDGYTGLVGEAGPEIFQIAQGKVSITPISQGQRTQVLNGGNVDMSETNNLLQTLIKLIAQGQTIQMDGRTVGQTIYDEVDSIMNKNLNRRDLMSIKGGA